MVHGVTMKDKVRKDQPAWVTDVLMAGDDDYDVLRAIQ